MLIDDDHSPWRFCDHVPLRINRSASWDPKRYMCVCVIYKCYHIYMYSKKLSHIYILTSNDLLMKTISFRFNLCVTI